ncbi:MAG: Jag N-terminal domain-containing protein [Thermodesulfobacteriota bacterium]|nr:Jag N-terminal domain-containing protein [Thermodesulfobacteriota bacterium]
MSEKTEFMGSDIADAIKKACESLNVSQENLDIDVLHTGSAGIFGLCRKKAKILVSVKKKEETKPEITAAIDASSAEKPPAPEPGEQKQPEPEEIEPGEKQPEPKEQPQKSKPDTAEKTASVSEPEKKTREPENKQISDISDKKNIPAEESAGEEILEVSTEDQEEVKAALVKLLQLMEFPSEVSVACKQNKITAHITGEYVDDIVGPEGQVLDGIQYLIRKKISKDFSGNIMFSLDAGDFRATRTKELETLALKLADEVKETSKTLTIRALSPAERRIVHIVLQNDNTIRSRSVGEGLFKKILIYLPGKGRKKSSYKRKKPGNFSKAKKTKS